MTSCQCVVCVAQLEAACRVDTVHPFAMTQLETRAQNNQPCVLSKLHFSGGWVGQHSGSMNWRSTDQNTTTRCHQHHIACNDGCVCLQKVTPAVFSDSRLLLKNHPTGIVVVWAGGWGLNHISDHWPCFDIWLNFLCTKIAQITTKCAFIFTKMY